jgi:hypothetical protein
MDFHAAKSSSYRSPDLKIFFRDVRQGKKRAITVRSWSTVKDVKDIIQQTIHVPAQSQRLYFGPLLTSGKELPNHRTLHDAGIYRSGETVLLDIKGGSSSMVASSPFALRPGSTSDIAISSSVFDSTSRMARSLVQEARRALALNLKPEFVLDGSGGTYFLHNSRKAKIAVFKPADEEPYAENNPRGYLRQLGQDMFLREGVVPGEACIREVAAFMLDHGGFSGVPMTTLVECRHPSFNTNGSRLTVAEGGASMGAHSLGNSFSKNSPSITKKVGSFQEFVRSDCSMDDLSPSKVSVDEVHKIAVLDIRLMNADRNAANLLCRRRRDNTIELVPIDHGFCLRTVADVSWMDWCWLDWPQLKEVSDTEESYRHDCHTRFVNVVLSSFCSRLTLFVLISLVLEHETTVLQPMSQRTKDYILNLDIAKDARILQERLNIRREALDYFYASSSILKAGTKAGLNLYEIAIMCCRNDNLGEVPSKLEVLFSMAADLAVSAVVNDRWGHAAASRALVEQLSPHGGSLLLPNATDSLTKKSQSAFDLKQFEIGLAGVNEPDRDKNMPSMTQSAGSDSSSDSGDVDREDCEEWAAALIADVSLDTSVRYMKANVKPRSPSIESDGSSESGGFWQRSPGSEGDSSSDDSGDEESVDWSAVSSPTREVLEGSFLNDSRLSYNPFDTVRRKSLNFNDDSMAVGMGPDGSLIQTSRVTRRTPSKVSFAEQHQLGSDEPLDPRLKHSNTDVGGKTLGLIAAQASNMRRSRSYSALSSAVSENVEEEMTKPAAKRPSFDLEHYREYYLKFVDLVIVRETTAAARTRS